MKKKHYNLIRRPDLVPTKSYVPTIIFERFFDILLQRSSSIELPDFLTPQIDVHEAQNAISLEIEIPGMNLEEFAYRVDGDIIHLKGEKRRSIAYSEGDYTRNERRFGMFERVLRLPAEVTHDNSSMIYEDGILKIVLPKKKDIKTDPMVEQGSAELF